MTTLLAFDNDGVLRDESVSYQRCVVETVAFFDYGKPATEAELTASLKQSNDDWDRTYRILQRRGIGVDFQTVKEHFQDLYLGKSEIFLVISMMNLGWQIMLNSKDYLKTTL